VLCREAEKPFATIAEMSEVRLNAYKIMWLIAMFDLPTKTKKERHDYAVFRKNLEKDGFVMHQYSVYCRFCASLEARDVHVKRVKSYMPSKGRLSIITITDKQYSGIINIWGEIEQKVQKRPVQLEFF
jgi:CRISPR-associated protein Cas2